MGSLLDEPCTSSRHGMCDHTVMTNWSQNRSDGAGCQDLHTTDFVPHRLVRITLLVVGARETRYYGSVQRTFPVCYQSFVLSKSISTSQGEPVNDGAAGRLVIGSLGGVTGEAGWNRRSPESRREFVTFITRRI